MNPTDETTQDQFLQATLANGYNGDNMQDVDSDRELAGDAELLAKIKALPIGDLIDYVFKQYVYKRHQTSCTKFSAINMMACGQNYNFSWDEINKIEDESIARGFKIGNGRQRGLGAKVVAYMRNKRFPSRAVAFFLVYAFTEEWKTLCEKGMVMQISIRVDKPFIQDVKVDNKIDSDKFGKEYGHATCIRRRKDLSMYEFVDSARGNTYYYVTEARLKKLIANGNVSDNVHIFIPLNLVKMITPDVPENQRYAPAVKRAIENGITSASATKAFNPDKPATRAEIVQFLKNFEDKVLAKYAKKQ